MSAPQGVNRTRANSSSSSAETGASRSKKSRTRCRAAGKARATARNVSSLTTCLPPGGPDSSANSQRNSRNPFCVPPFAGALIRERPWRPEFRQLDRALG